MLLSLKQIFLIAICLINIININAQISLNTNIDNKSIYIDNACDTLVSPVLINKKHLKSLDRFDRITSSQWYQMFYITVPMAIVGVIVTEEDKHFNSLRNDFLPQFKQNYDDYTQFAPAALMLGLKSFGYEGRSSWGRMLVSDAFSAGIMATVVNSLKYTIKRERPDGNGRNSFPSGHTATAFMTATMLHKEYGDRSPWFSIGGYACATLTGLTRQFNNRHWMGDVMVGASIGIISPELGYLLADLIFKEDRQSVV